MTLFDSVFQAYAHRRTLSTEGGRMGGLMSTPHISAAPGDFSDVCLLPGDPLRARYVAERFLDDPGLVRRQRCVRCLVDRAIDLDSRRKARGEEQVRAFALDHLPEQVLRQSYRLFAFHVLVSLRAVAAPLEILFLHGPEPCLFLADQSFPHQFGEVLIERLHAR